MATRKPLAWSRSEASLHFDGTLNTMFGRQAAGMTGAIFISYREADAKGWALLLRDALAERFGNESLFFDKDGLHAGKWSPQLDGALSHNRATLVVIGPNWLGAMDDQGRRRLEQPGDVHRREIAISLARPDVTVIPVLVEGASQPKAEQLPEDIRGLAAQQTLQLSDTRRRRAVDMDRLVADLEIATGLAAKASAKTSVRELLWRVVRAAGVAILASVAIAVGAEAALAAHLDNGEVAVFGAGVFVLTLVLPRLRMKRQRPDAEDAVPHP